MAKSAEFDPKLVEVYSARAVILNAQSEILLLQRQNDAKRNRNQWECPGGRIEDGETVDAARRREVLEETGLEFEYIENNFYTEVRPYTESERLGALYVAYFSLVRATSEEVTRGRENQAYLWTNHAHTMEIDLAPETRNALYENRKLFDVQ